MKMLKHEELYRTECWSSGVALKADFIFRVSPSAVSSKATIRFVDIGTCICSAGLRTTLEAE
jgi:hypothetical protein